MCSMMHFGLFFVLPEAASIFGLIPPPHRNCRRFLNSQFFFKGFFSHLPEKSRRVFGTMPKEKWSFFTTFNTEIAVEVQLGISLRGFSGRFWKTIQFLSLLVIISRVCLLIRWLFHSCTISKEQKVYYHMPNK